MEKNNNNLVYPLFSGIEERKRLTGYRGRGRGKEERKIREGRKRKKGKK